MEAELENAAGDPAAAALQAARLAGGLAPLWLEAGFLGQRIGAPWAADALERAQRLDPLSPLASFHLMMARRGDPEAVTLGSRAVRADPRLARASFWHDHRDLASRVAAATGMHLPDPRALSATEPQMLTLILDREPAVSFSLYAFRRSPWPGRLAPAELRGFPTRRDTTIE